MSRREAPSQRSCARSAAVTSAGPSDGPGGPSKMEDASLAAPRGLFNTGRLREAITAPVPKLSAAEIAEPGRTAPKAARVLPTQE
mmetsp:Transcript_89963/g.199898  ORF Transcript_89963/g.199898 Transcript_89963/m.199898 type:complete len:85 (-) Transcript_89963:54-308(-)